MVRQPAVANQFYPGNPRDLTAMVDQMLADAEPPAVSGRVLGIQVPHAGYPYSGPTAANAFRLVQGMDNVTVVMVGPSHQAYITRAAAYAKGKWRTPLGEVEVDGDLAKAIVARDDYLVEAPDAHRAEHSLEVQLPFLQRALGRFRIVPITLLDPTWRECERTGKAIAEACQGRSVLLLASTDLYHGQSYETARKTDSVTGELLAGFDPEALYDGLKSGKASACGGAPVVVMMVAARALGADRATVLAMTNSNDVTGEQGGYCVGYSATVFTASSEAHGARPAETEDELTQAEKKILLDIARSTVEQYVREGKRPKTAMATARLAEKRGAFVTLHKKGELRGCIGYVEAVKPLYLAVSDMAVAASTEDPRFPPVKPAELQDIDIEITVLSPIRKIDDPNKIEVGKHGLIVRRGGYSGLLLPQVPVEQGWNREQFLAHTCLKAGLPFNTWQEKGTELHVFTGQVFGEGKPGD